MPEHYTKNTLEVGGIYCSKCKRQTRHRVDKGRRGPCLECGQNTPEQVSVPVELMPACRCSAHSFPHAHDLESRRWAARKWNDDVRAREKGRDQYFVPLPERMW